MDKSDFLHQLNVALGFTDLMPAREPDILKEILRLREAAGEMDSIRSPHDMEIMTAESVRGVPYGGDAKICSLWITTKAQIVESSSQIQGQPVQKEILELPQRQVNLVFDEEQTREVHRILGERIEDWDAEG